MFCRHCGASIPDDSSFCPKCGKSIESIPIKQTPSLDFDAEPQKTVVPKRKRSLSFVMALAVVFAIICVAAFIRSQQKTRTSSVETVSANQTTKTDSTSTRPSTSTSQSGTSAKPSTQAPAKKPEPLSYPAGTYEVGKDIPAGEYVLFRDCALANFIVSSDGTGTFDSQITSDIFDYNTILTVESGQFLQLAGCHAISIKDKPEVLTTGSGMFKVGEHLAAGLYRITPDPVSEERPVVPAVFLSVNSKHIMENNLFTRMVSDPFLLFLKDGQYLNLNHCTAKKVSLSDVGAYRASTYKVGSDIPAGTYVFFADTGFGYLEIDKDSKGSLDSIVYNENISSFDIAEVKDGQYLKTMGCYALPLSEFPYLDTTGDGVFLIGTHLPAGEYKLSATGSMEAYYEVDSIATPSVFDIVTNDLFSGSTYITVQDGQYLKLRNCRFESGPRRYQGLSSKIDIETFVAVLLDEDFRVYLKGGDSLLGDSLYKSNTSETYGAADLESFFLNILDYLCQEMTSSSPLSSQAKDSENTIPLSVPNVSLALEYSYRLFEYVDFKLSDYAASVNYVNSNVVNSDRNTLGKFS